MTENPEIPDDDLEEVSFIGLKMVSGETIVGMKLNILDETGEDMDDDVPFMVIVNPFVFKKMTSEDGETVTVLDRWIHHVQDDAVNIYPIHVMATFTPTDKMLNGYLNTVKFVEDKEQEKEQNESKNDYENPDITYAPNGKTYH